MKRVTCIISTVLVVAVTLLSGCDIWDFMRENSEEDPAADTVIQWQPGMTILDEQIYAYNMRFISEDNEDVYQAWQFRTYSGFWQLRRPRSTDPISLTDWGSASASMELGLHQCDSASRAAAREIIAANNGTIYDECSDSTQFGYCFLYVRHWNDTAGVRPELPLLSLLDSYNQHDDVFRGVYLSGSTSFSYWGKPE